MGYIYISHYETINMFQISYRLSGRPVQFFTLNPYRKDHYKATSNQQKIVTR